MTDRKTGEHQRAFERYPLDFTVEITGTLQTKSVFSDCGKMSNISGSGLCFTTRHADWYSVGQKLGIQICLPGTDKLEAGMTMDARVIWIHFPEQEKKINEKCALIGLAMNTCMSFKTTEIKPA